MMGISSTGSALDWADWGLEADGDGVTEAPVECRLVHAWPHSDRHQARRKDHRASLPHHPLRLRDDRLRRFGFVTVTMDGSTISTHTPSPRPLPLSL